MARWRDRWGTLTLQVVNGLDSTGFSSQQFVVGGHQGRFEEIRATDLAGVARLDLTPIPGLLVGGAAYYGGTSRNRPKADLVESCDDPDPDEVASCGHVSANLLVLSGHAVVDLGPVRASALVLYGHLEHADLVSARNARLSNTLGVARTPVSGQALALFGEVGYDVAPHLGLAGDHRLEPFVRVDWYDTMWKPREELFDNPRFERLVATGGISYTLADRYFAKLDLSQRRFGTSALRKETGARISTGFVY